MSARKKYRPRPVDTNPLARLMPQKLTPAQIRDLGICHMSNLDAIARGQATPEIMLAYCGSVLTWHYVAESLGLGEAEMEVQLALMTAMVDRFNRTGKILFSGPDYQTAKAGTEVMDLLALETTKPIALAAAERSEREINERLAPVLLGDEVEA